MRDGGAEEGGEGHGLCGGYFNGGEGRTCLRLILISGIDLFSWRGVGDGR